MSGFRLRLRTAGLLGTGNGLGAGLGGGGGKKITRRAMGIHVNALAPTTIWGDYSQNAANNHFQVPIPNMGLGSIRLWDSDGCTWRNIERTQGVFSWGRLDNAVNLATAAGLDMILNLGHGPDWATTSPGQMPGLYVGYNPFPPINDTVWTNWCTAIGSRYAGRGIYYEIWNEINDQHSGPSVAGSGYMGSAASMVNLAQLARAAILAVDPTAKFLTPNFVNQAGITGEEGTTVNLDTYLEAGGGAHADIISIHGYNTLPPWTRPEGMIHMAKRVRDTLAKYGVNKPIWNTEWGFGRWRDETGAFHSVPGQQPYPEPMPDQKGADYVTRMCILSWCGGFERFYWYALDGVRSYNSVVMVNPNSAQNAQTLLPPAYAFKFFSDFFLDGYLSELQALASSTGVEYFRAGFTTKSKRRGIVYWCDDYTTTTVDIPGAKAIYDNLGGSVTVTPTLTVSGSPKFVLFN